MPLRDSQEHCPVVDQNRPSDLRSKTPNVDSRHSVSCVSRRTPQSQKMPLPTRRTLLFSMSGTKNSSRKDGRLQGDQRKGG